MRTLTACLTLLLVCSCSDDTTPSGADGSPPDAPKGAEAGADLKTGDGPKVPDQAPAADQKAGGDQAAADLPAPSEAGGCPSGTFVLKNMGPGKCVKLPASVTLPVDSAVEADAIKKASGCTCKCAKWEQKSGKWRCYCCDKYPDCLVEIDAATAATRCEQYG